MPQTYGFESMELRAPSVASSARAVTGGIAEPEKRAAERSSGVAQKAFLHQTLMAIGTELDEGQAAKKHPTAQSARHRDNLRKHYATHTDNECEDLRKAVAAKQREVAVLKQQAQQLQRYVEATRLAAERRKSRLRSGDSGVPGGFNASAVSGAARAKRNILSMAGSAVWDADAPNAKAKNIDAVEELHQNLVRAMETDQAMRAQVEDQIKLLDQQTIRRKAAEAGLFNTHADILRLRAQALQQEARQTRLANELRRVYKHLPRVVQQRLAQSSASRGALTQGELAGLRETHRKEHFKFLACEDLVDELEVVEDQLGDTSLHERDVIRALEEGDAVVRSAMEEMVTVRLALASLNEAWAKFATDLSPQAMRSPIVNRKPALGQSDESAEPEEDITVLMHQASLTAATIEELVSLMHATGAESDEDDTSTNPASSRHASRIGSRPGSRLDGGSRPSSRPQSRMTLGAVPSFSPEASRQGSVLEHDDDDGEMPMHRVKSC